MGRSPCCDEEMRSVKKGPWTVEEDEKLKEYIKEKGHGSWRALPKLAGLNRCGKSCRLRWTNYLRPDIKRGKFTEEEERQIIHLHSIKGNKWSEIARHLPGRTDNEIKNLWNTHLRKKLLKKGIDPVTHQPRLDLALLADLPNLLSTTFAANSLDHTTALRLHSDAANLAKLKVLQNLLQVFIPSSTDNNMISSTPSTMLAAAPLNIIDPTQNLHTDYQSHLLNQSSFPADLINPIHNVTVDLQQNMMPGSNINGASCYNVTSLHDMVDLNNYYKHGTREQSCSTSTVTGSSTTSLESSTGAAEVYNPWISELLCEDFQLMDAVDQSNH